MRKLIINADDCNLTPGVTRGILKSHDEGILTSTTVLINLPIENKTIRALKARPRLGVGLHLNVTLGKPVSRVAVGARRAVPLLTDSNGQFRRPLDYWKKRPLLKDVVSEYDAQIQLFKKNFGNPPDHLDTHHHLHDDLLFFRALAVVARKWKLPIRRSRIFLAVGAPLVGAQKGQAQGLPLRTTDYLFGNLEAKFHWQMRPFLGVIENLTDGSSEIACHPAFCDRALREISSFREPRQEELKLFSNKKLRKTLADLEIELIRFSDI